MKVYSGVGEIKKPEFSSTFFKEKTLRDFENIENQYVKDIKEWCIKNGTGKFKGREVAFPFADGYARYVVFQSEGNKWSLIHLEVGDAWDYPFIHRLHPADIKREIQTENYLKELMF